jgi:hypothetical protein
MVASLDPVAPPPVLDDEELNPAAAAGALLEQGMVLFRNGEFSAASSAFGYAIATDRLNNAGRALAYWHVYVSQQQLGRVDASADALTSFVVVAEDVLEVRSSMRFAVNEAGDFVDRFELPSKLRRARAMLSATWAGRVEQFGRSVQQPVPVHDEDELDQFLSIVAPCNEGGRQDQMRHQVPTESGHPVHRVTLSCGGLDNTVNYFFDMIGE